MFKRLLLSIFLLLTTSRALAWDAQNLVVATKGTMPLILTVPHDGGEFIGMLQARKKGVTVRDTGTKELAEQVAAILETRTGKRPYLVIAKFSRKFLDANRIEQEAMESDEALPVYKVYHGHIATYISEMKRAFPSGSLLIDVHGQSDDPNTVFRGTRSGLTTKALVSRFGRSSIQGEKSILGALSAKGYAVNPSIDIESLKEDLRFAGGYTVFNYGSQYAEGIDSIQLEFGKNQRASSHLAQDLADAIVIFMTHHQLL